jgi:hypothetical protein
MPLRMPSDTLSIPYATVVFLGDPKIGKTRLAGMFPDAYIMDFDEGAAHASAVSNTYPRNAKGYDVALNELKRLAQLQPGKSGALQHTVDGHKFPVRTLVLDTLTELQNYARLKIEKGGKSWNKQRFYGDLLDLVRDFITIARSVNAHLVMTVHTKTTIEEEGSGQDKKTWEWVDIRLEGSIRDLLPGWADLILYLVNEPKTGQKYMLTQETRIGQRIYRAGDRYHIFEGQKLQLYKGANGDLNPEIVEKIIGVTEGGQRIVEVEPWKAWTAWDDIAAWVSENGRDVQEAKDVLAEKSPGFSSAKFESYYQILTEFWKENPVPGPTQEGEAQEEG